MLYEFRRAILSEGRRIINKRNANNADLRNAIHSDFIQAVKQTRNIAHRFKAGNWHDTARNVHRFIRKNFLYLRDNGQRQQIKLPSKLIRDLYADCKSFSLFPASILFNLGAPGLAFKYASYPSKTGELSKIPSHIYVRLEDESGNEIILDGTSSRFNYEKPPYYSFTVNPMRVETLSDEVLAQEVLNDETLSGGAVKSFMKRLRKKSKAARKKFFKSFNPKNRAKLMKSIRSHVKNTKLSKMRGRAKNPVMSGVAGISYESDDIHGRAFVNDDADGHGLYGKKRKAKRAEKKAKKAAKAKPGSNKQKRLATKAKLLKAKATGDKALLKEAKKERKKRIKENVEKVGHFIKKLEPILALGRGSFIGLLAINLRGYATNIAIAIEDNPKNKEKIADKWKKLGGKPEKLWKAVNRGKNKKSLLGQKGGKRELKDKNKKIKDEILSGWEDGNYSLGAAPAAAAIAAAGTVIGALIPLVTSLMKKSDNPKVKKAAEALDVASAAITAVSTGAVPGSEDIVSAFKNIKTNLMEKVTDFVADAKEAGKTLDLDKLKDLIEVEGAANMIQEDESPEEAKAEAEEIIKPKSIPVIPLVAGGLLLAKLAA